MSVSTVLLILGNQLFPISTYKKLKTKKVFMAEDHGLCTHFKYHKHKIIFFLVAMRNYRDELVKAGFDVTYISCEDKTFKKPYESKFEKFLKENKDINTIETFEIEDKFFETRVSELCKKKKLNFNCYKSPLFVVSRDGFKKYLSDVKKPFMKTFYERQRKAFSILLDDKGKPTGGKWSYDAENRKKLPKDLETPKIPKIKLSKNHNDVIKFVDVCFKDHPGESSEFWLPTTRKEALKWLNDFIKNRLENFGSYQDAITSNSDFVFHSVISPMLNMGLILPGEIIEKVESQVDEGVALNSIEGFIRQVLGWREFVRGIYQNFEKEQWEGNFWGHERKLSKDWYEGTTGIPVLDDAINKTLKYSYAHHIERLMILSNFMLLCEIHPREVHKWFMELYSDSSDWVMGPNVFGMGQFSDGGIFATKPYICGSNYLIKMSDYKKGEWCDIADGLYWRFIDKHLDFYSKKPRMSVMVGALGKMKTERKDMIFNKADEFISRVTL